MSQVHLSLLAAVILQATSPQECVKPGSPATQGGSAVDARKPVSVSRDKLIIEEKSLLLDGSLSTLNADKVERYRSGYVGADQTSSGLNALATRTGMTDSEAEIGNGIRLYSFELKPREEMKLRLQSEDSKLVMRFLMPTSPGAFGKDIRRANLSPTPVRRSQITITNSSDAPSKAMLMLTGPVNCKYRIEILRKS